VRSRVMVMVCAVGLLAAACSGSGGDTLGTGDGYSVLGALAELPAEAGDGEVMVVTADLQAATEAAQLERPDAPEASAVLEWLSPLTGGPRETGPLPVFVPLGDVFNPPYLARHEEFADELGWSVTEVDAFVEASAPPRMFAVVTGDFADDAPLGEPGAEGIVTVGEEEDLAADPGNGTAARPLGRPLHQVRKEQRLAVTRSSGQAAAWASGPEATLAGHEALAAAAGALDEAGAFSAVLVAGTSMTLPEALGPNASESTLKELEEEYRDLLPAIPFTAVGVGWSTDERGGAEVTVAYVLPDEDAAEQAVTALGRQLEEGDSLRGRPLAELITLREAARDGNVAVLTLGVPEGSRPGVVYQLLQDRDLPFLHR
jgi:hypothetical protein